MRRTNNKNKYTNTITDKKQGCIERNDIEEDPNNVIPGIVLIGIFVFFSGNSDALGSRYFSMACGTVFLPTQTIYY